MIRMLGGSRRRRAFVLVAACACAAVLALPGSGVTDASFTDAEYTASGTVKATTLAPPQITAVVNCSGLLGIGLANGVTLKWKWATGTPSAFTPTNNVQWAYNSAGNNWRAVATTDNGDGTFQTTFNTGVISDLLSLLLGGTMTFQTRTVAGSNWTSGGVSKVVFHNSGGGALGLSPYCEAPVNGS